MGYPLFGVSERARGSEEAAVGVGAAGRALSAAAWLLVGSGKHSGAPTVSSWSAEAVATPGRALRMHKKLEKNVRKRKNERELCVVPCEMPLQGIVSHSTPSTTHLPPKSVAIGPIWSGLSVATGPACVHAVYFGKRPAEHTVVCAQRRPASLIPGSS